MAVAKLEKTVLRAILIAREASRKLSAVTVFAIRARAKTAFPALKIVREKPRVIPTDAFVADKEPLAVIGDVDLSAVLTKAQQRVAVTSNAKDLKRQICVPWIAAV